MAINKFIGEYSPDGKLFASIDEHGILRIWDTETNTLKQEYAPNLHLSNPCTCLVWFQVNKNLSAKKHKKHRLSSNDNPVNTEQSLYIALGTVKGLVSLYSFSSGEVERNIKGEGHSGKVTCIVFDGQDIIYTGGNDSHIICWSISNEKRIASWKISGNEKINSLEYLPQSKNLLIGCRQIKVFSIEKQEEIHSHVGHTSEISILKSFTFDSSEYCLSTSKSERIISIWLIKSKNKYRNAISTLLMEDVANCLMYKFDERNQNLKVGVVTRSGVVHLYSIDPNLLKADKPIKPSTTLQIASDSNANIEPIMAVTVSLEFNEVLLGYGDNQFLIFEKITPNYSDHVQVVIRTHPRKTLNKNKSFNEVSSKTIAPDVDGKNVQYKSSTLPLKGKKKDVQIPLETRLQNLHVTSGEGLPNAQSKVQLLIQALHSKDATLLQTVLLTDDTKVINLTLQRLPVQYVSTLVNELTLLMEKKQTNVKVAANWLKILVKTHSSQLMALGSDDLIAKFGPCMGIIEHRSNCLKDLLGLNGRLQLLVSQIKRNVEQDVLASENCVIYEDGSSDSDEDSEKVSTNSSESDLDWEDKEDHEDQNTKQENNDSNESDDDDDEEMDDESS